MLNIHPALLPAFKGLDTHTRALEAGAKVHGATVHFVVPEMDSGPIIMQGAVAVARGRQRTETLAARVLAVEHRIYPLALGLVAQGRVRVENGRCLIDGVPVPDVATLVPSPLTAHHSAPQHSVHLNINRMRGVVVCIGGRHRIGAPFAKRGTPWLGVTRN